MAQIDIKYMAHPNMWPERKRKAALNRIEFTCSVKVRTKVRPARAAFLGCGVTFQPLQANLSPVPLIKLADLR